MMRMFSSRLNWDIPANPLARLLQEKRSAGARVLDLTESNPTQAGISYPREILRAFDEERGLRYEPSPRGSAPAREAVAEYYAERGRVVSPDRIVLTASTSEAYAWLFKLLADPGDEVLTPRPSYPLFEFLAGLECVRVRQYPLRYDGAWHVDFEELERGISERTRAIVVVNPNNPTGSFLREGEKLDAMARSRGLALMMDEVFWDYGLGDCEPSRSLLKKGTRYVRSADRSVHGGFPAEDGSLVGGDSVVSPLFPQAAAKTGALTFTMSGLSKIAGLPQMKLGWVVVEGDGADAAIERLEFIADTFLSVATPVQAALARLMELSRGVRAQIRDRTRENLNVLRAAVARSDMDVLNVEGGWSAILRVPRVRSEQEWVLMLLGERDVLVQPGYFYDFESEAYLVVSLLTRPEVFHEGIGRII
jgi:alanine-synthesizing transaminase